MIADITISISVCVICSNIGMNRQLMGITNHYGPALEMFALSDRVVPFCV